MKAQAENIASSNMSFVAYTFESNEFVHPFHFHHETEIVFINRGSGEVIIGNTSSEYNAGDIFLIGANIPHRFYSNKADPFLCSYVLQFSQECFGELFNSPELSRVNNLINQSRYGLIIRQASPFLFKDMKKLIQSTGLDSVINFLQLLGNIDSNQKIEILAKTPNPISEVKIETKILATIEWIDQNYFRDICLEDVASKTSMNKNAFCRVFKLQTGRSPMQYICEKRVEEASNLLMNSAKTITEIGYAVGFPTISSFNRNFKKIRNTSPKSYRSMANIFAE